MAILDLIKLGGVEGCPTEVDVHLGCGVVGRFPRGGEQGAAAGPVVRFLFIVYYTVRW